MVKQPEPVMDDGPTTLEQCYDKVNSGGELDPGEVCLVLDLMLNRRKDLNPTERQAIELAAGHVEAGL